MKKAIFVSIVTLFHAATSWSLFFISFAGGMRRFDDGALPEFSEKILDFFSKLLLWPVFYPLSIWGPRWLTKVFGGLLGYIPILLNSLVWGLAVWWLYSRHNKALQPTWRKAPRG